MIKAQERPQNFSLKLSMPTVGSLSYDRRTKLTAASASEAVMSGRARWTA